MTDVSKTEAALVVAKAKCFKTCGQMDPAVAGDRALAEMVHAEHRAELEEAYAAFQAEGLAAGEASPSNPASGKTELSADITVDSGLN